MTMLPPQFEQADVLGTTGHYNGSVGTTAVAIPSVAGNKITEVLVQSPQSNSSSKELYVSFDGGTTFFTLYRGGALFWKIKGTVTQVYVKGNISTVDYEILMNRDNTAA